MIRIFIVCILLNLLFNNIIAQVTDRHISLAKEFLLYLQTSDTQNAVDMFDEVVRGQVSPQQLKEYWYGVNMQAGRFKEHYDTRTEESHGYQIVYLACRFENLDLDIKVVFSTELKIAGFFFIPGSAKHTYLTPDYDNPDVYQVKEVELHTGKYLLPGKLTLPTKIKSFPLAILVHGSGPNDMDETIGPNKIFRDLAVGLAGQGIATLRYEKRTKKYGLEMDGSTLTVYEETIEDVLSAIAMSHKVSGVSSVVVIGHSLGAFVAPRIAKHNDTLDGIVLMAGNSRPLEDLVLEQVSYIYSLDGLTPEEEKMMDELKALVEQIKRKEFPEATLSEGLLLNLSPAYWLDLAAYNPVSTAEALSCPMLILQGERDYQVTMEDFKIWKENLGEKTGVTFKSYPDLNHLFMKGQGMSVPAEYEKPGNVAGTVIHDIATWIKKVCQ